MDEDDPSADSSISGESSASLENIEIDPYRSSSEDTNSSDNHDGHEIDNVEEDLANNNDPNNSASLENEEYDAYHEEQHINLTANSSFSTPDRQFSMARSSFSTPDRQFSESERDDVTAQDTDEETAETSWQLQEQPVASHSQASSPKEDDEPDDPQVQQAVFESLQHLQALAKKEPPEEEVDDNEDMAIAGGSHTVTPEKRKNKAGNGLRCKNQKFSSQANERRASVEQDAAKAVPPPVKKQKMTIKEEHLHGPFDFSAHRKEEKKTTPPVETPPYEVIDLANRKSPPPTVIEIHDDPPPVVHIDDESETDVHKLHEHLMEMFPSHPSRFLLMKAKGLVGNPVSTEQFISDLLLNGVPENWEYELDRDAMNIGQPPMNEIASHNQDSGVGNVVTTDENILFMPDSNVVPGPSNEKPGGSSQMQEAVSIAEVVAAPVPGSSKQTPEEELEEWIGEKLTLLEDIFKKTDPEFLRDKVLKFSEGKNTNELEEFINFGLETKEAEFPNREAYDQRKKEEDQADQYASLSKAEEFMEMYDDEPEKYFSCTEKAMTPSYKEHAAAQLKKDFRWIASKDIQNALKLHNWHYYPAYKELTCFKGLKRKTKRNDHEFYVPRTIDLNFLKELQFTRIAPDIEAYRRGIKENHEARLAEAKEANLLENCECCFDDEVLPEEILKCPVEHPFCKTCIKRASEVAIGEGKTSLDCLTTCDKQFELSVLQQAIRPNVFSKWLRKIQLAEIQEAQVEGLVQCPFCPFATIMESTPEENKLFTCLNPECGKESCRLCNEISHIPLRCEEVEKDEEVRKRTFIENKMSEALIRTCYKCKKPFFKIDGCNKMNCSCGAQMCYLCKQPVKDYQHFYGQGAPAIAGKCPLWSDNKRLMESDVKRGAIEAKRELATNDPELNLKNDPAPDVKPTDVDEPDPAIFQDGIGGDAFPPQFIAYQHHIEAHIRDPLINRMGELLQMREVHRARQRAIRRREQLALQEYREFRRRHHVLPYERFNERPPSPPLGHPPAMGPPQAVLPHPLPPPPPEYQNPGPLHIPGPGPLPHPRPVDHLNYPMPAGQLGLGRLPPQPPQVPVPPRRVDFRQIGPPAGANPPAHQIGGHRVIHQEGGHRVIHQEGGHRVIHQEGHRVFHHMGPDDLLIDIDLGQPAQPPPPRPQPQQRVFDQPYDPWVLPPPDIDRQEAERQLRRERQQEQERLNQQRAFEMRRQLVDAQPPRPPMFDWPDDQDLDEMWR